VLSFFFWQTNLKYTFQQSSAQATYGTRTLNCEPSIAFYHHSAATVFLLVFFSRVLLWVKAYAVGYTNMHDVNLADEAQSKCSSYFLHLRVTPWHIQHFSHSRIASEMSKELLLR
jgi:hypothetical protein